MWYCGSAKIRSDPNNQTDGLSGSLPLTEEDLQATGASGEDKVKLVVKKDGRYVETERAIHADGRSITLPTQKRRKLDLELEDEVEYWIDLVEEQEGGKERTGSENNQQTLTGEVVDENVDTKLAAKFPGQDTYHYIGSQDAEETVCGITLDGRDYRTGQEPSGGLLELCRNCAVRSAGDMSNEEIVDWLSSVAGFEKTEGPPSYLNKNQLLQLRDYILELQDKAREREGGATTSPRENEWDEDSSYSLKLTVGTEEQIITGSTQSEVLADTIEIMMMEYGLERELSIPYVPGDKNAVINDEPAHPDGREMGRKRDIAESKYFVNTEPTRELKMKYLEELADKVGASIKFRNGWKQ